MSPLAQALTVAMALTVLLSPIAHGCGTEADLLTWCIIMLQKILRKNLAPLQSAVAYMHVKNDNQTNLDHLMHNM